MEVRFFTKRAVAGAFGAAAMLLAGVAQATLQDRDLDKSGVTDAYYDTDLDITWLRDANVNGLMDWDTAVSWAGGYSIAGYGDWRLPTADPSCRFGAPCPTSEMGHLWSVELSNSDGVPPNTGGFQNLQHGSIYWSGTEYSDPLLAFGFSMSGGGFQGLYGNKLTPAFAMAVRNGDVPAIPEPATYSLLLAGLAGLALARRQRRR